MYLIYLNDLNLYNSHLFRFSYYIMFQRCRIPEYTIMSYAKLQNEVSVLVN